MRRVSLATWMFAVVFVCHVDVAMFVVAPSNVIELR